VTGSADVLPDHLLDLTDPAHPTGTDSPLSEPPPQPLPHAVLQQEPLEKLAPNFRLFVLASTDGTGEGVIPQGSEYLQVPHEGEVLDGFIESGGVDKGTQFEAGEGRMQETLSQVGAEEI
jgi:hypothetical protein